MNELPNTSPEELARRVADLERELARVQAERDRLQASFNKLADIVVPVEADWSPPRPEDAINARTLLAELEARHLGGTK